MTPGLLVFYILITMAVVAAVVGVAGGLAGFAALILLVVAGRLYTMWSRKARRQL